MTYNFSFIYLVIYASSSYSLVHVELFKNNCKEFCDDNNNNDKDISQYLINIYLIIFDLINISQY